MSMNLKAASTSSCEYNFNFYEYEVWIHPQLWVLVHCEHKFKFLGMSKTSECP